MQHNESAGLAAARDLLAQAESALDTPQGLAALRDGLGLLDDVAGDASAAEARIARNLGAAYADNVHQHVERRLGSGLNLSEAELQHAFAMLRAFDATVFAVPAGDRALKIELVRRLIDIYYEGYPQAAKQRAIDELAAMSGVDGDD
jgi:hypothetical protein